MTWSWSHQMGMLLLSAQGRPRRSDLFSITIVPFEFIAVCIGGDIGSRHCDPAWPGMLLKQEKSVPYTAEQSTIRHTRLLNGCALFGVVTVGSADRVFVATVDWKGLRGCSPLSSYH